MGKIVDSSQLLDLAKNGFLKNGTKIISNDEDKFEYVFKGETFWDDRNEEMAVSELMYHRFEILSEEDKEINIQNIHELQEFTNNRLYDTNSIHANRQKINKLIRIVKQLDKKIKGEK